MLNSVRRSNLDRYIVNLKQKAREGAGKRMLPTASPSAAKKQSTKVLRIAPFFPAFLHLLTPLPLMQRSRAEEEGKWDAVSKAIQKVPQHWLPPIALSLLSHRLCATTPPLTTAITPRTLPAAAVDDVRAAWHYETRASPHIWGASFVHTLEARNMICNFMLNKLNALAALVPSPSRVASTH